MMLTLKFTSNKTLTALSRRGFYFNALSTEDKNFPDLDFPLNVGYNDHF